MKNTPNNHEHSGSIRPYIIGFLLSLLFTFIPYFLVVHKTLPNNLLISTLLIFAFIQLVVQLVFFLHLGREKNPRWQLIFFISTAALILVVVLGSIWIMSHLNYNMMPEQMGEFLIKDEGMSQKSPH